MASIVVMRRFPIDPTGSRQERTGCAVQMHGACTALRYTATELRSRESEYIAKNPKQGHIRGDVEVM